MGGSSIYYNISQSCNISSLLDVATSFNFSETDGHLATSPNKLAWYSPAALKGNKNSVTIYKVNLGQVINIPTCVLDHQNNSAGKVLFKVTHIDFNQNYSLIAPNFMLLSSESLRVGNIHIIGESVGEPVGEGDNLSITIQFSSS